MGNVSPGLCKSYSCLACISSNINKLSEKLEDIEKRDYNDSHRDVDPLRQAEDAELLDTTNMSVEDVVKAIGDRIRSL